MNGRLSVLLTALVVVPAASGSQETYTVPVARVLQVKGTVRIMNPDGKNRVAEVYGVVREDEHLIVKAESEITLGFRTDGHIERLSGPSTSTVSKEKISGPATRIKKIEPPKKHRQLVADTVKKLKPLSREGTRLLKGSSDITASMRPIHTSTVLSRQPVLQWAQVAEATGYEVTMSDATGKQLWKVVTSRNQLDLTPERVLDSGAKYTWQVRAKLEQSDSRLVCRGEFVVATDQQRAVAEQIEQVVATADVEYLVLAASWYEANGMLSEAIAANCRVIELAPPSAAAHRALAELYERAELWEDAKQATEQAKSIRTQRRGPAGGGVNFWMTSDVG